MHVRPCACRVPGLAALLLLAACGGGGGGSSAAPVQLITSNVVQAMPAGYRAVFDASARVSVSTAPVPIDLTGTYTLSNEGTTVVYPLDTSRSGTKVKSEIELVVPQIVRNQYPSLPATVLLTLREYVEFANDGTWYALGGDAEDPTAVPPVTHVSWAATPTVDFEPTIFPGQTVDVPETDVLADDLVTVLASRKSTRTVALATEVLDTPLGRLECYRSDVIETVQPNAPGALPVEVTYRRWERPDLGLIQLHLENYQVTVTYQMQPVTITVQRMDAYLRSLAP